MNAIRIRTTLTSETRHLPELKPLIGRTVEIVVLDETDSPLVRSGTGDWEAAANAAQRLREGGFDFDACRLQREYDRREPKLPR